MKIHNFGSLNIDHVYEVEQHVRTGETITAGSYQLFLGGKGLNQSIAIAKANGDVRHVGAIGQDGQALKDALTSAGVDTSGIKVVDASSGHAIIQVNQEGDNSIVIYGGANQQVSQAQIDEAFKTITQDDLVLCQNEISNLDYVIDKAYENNIPVALNFSPITSGLLRVDLNKVTYLLVNEIEGLSAAKVNHIDEIVNTLINKYPNIHVILTLGEKGSIYSAKHQSSIYQQAIKVDVVDTTGAGDTFTGYFLAHLAKGEPIDRCLLLAAHASSISISRPGASPSIPTLKEVEEKL